MLIDYHLHNHFSPDSQADTREMLKAAQNLNISEVCFTNHAEWFSEEDHVGIFDYEEAIRRFESIKWEIEHLQSEFPELPIKIGTEITYKKEDLPEIERFLKNADLDFALGSIHNIDGHIINSSKSYKPYFAPKSETEAYGKYFAKLKELVQWGQFDAIAHFDVIKKYGHEYYGPFEPGKYETEIREILAIAKEKELGIELNSRCLKSKCKELFPHPTILKWALEAGIQHFTLSSDAHKTEDAGHFVTEALEIAREVGIAHVTTYEKRRHKLIKM